jgi:hypothetical protein
MPPSGPRIRDVDYNQYEFLDILILQTNVCASCVAQGLGTMCAKLAPHASRSTMHIETDKRT